MVSFYVMHFNEKVAAFFLKNINQTYRYHYVGSNSVMRTLSVKVSILLQYSSYYSLDWVSLMYSTLWSLLLRVSGTSLPQSPPVS